MKDREKILAKIREMTSKGDAKENKEAKKLAMRNNVKLGKLRKEFCQKCFEKLEGRTRIKNGFKIVECKNCGDVMRWKIAK